MWSRWQPAPRAIAVSTLQARSFRAYSARAHSAAGTTAIRTAHRRQSKVCGRQSSSATAMWRLMWHASWRRMRPSWPAPIIVLPLLQNIHQFLHRVGALLQHGLLFRREFDLVDLLDAAFTQFHRHSDEHPMDEIGRASCRER